MNSYDFLKAMNDIDVDMILVAAVAFLLYFQL